MRISDWSSDVCSSDLRPGENKGGKEFNFEATPIKIGDSVYFCTPHRDVIALDAVTGKERWRFDPNNDTSANTYLSCRGVAYYTPPAGATGVCAEEIISTDRKSTRLNSSH